MVADRNLDRASGEFGDIHPGERCSAGLKLRLDDTPTGLVDHVVASPLQLRQKARFSSTRAPREHDVTFADLMASSVSTARNHEPNLGTSAGGDAAECPNAGAMRSAMNDLGRTLVQSSTGTSWIRDQRNESDLRLRTATRRHRWIIGDIDVEVGGQSRDSYR